MKKLQIPSNVTRAFHRAGLQLKKHSPEILVVTGIVGTVASAVMACKATLKVDEVKENTKEKIDKVHTALEKGHTEAGEEYSVEDSKKDLTVIYAQTGIDFVKLYGPSVVLGGLSVASILAGHNILRKRNVALAAAYTAVDKSFKEYRGRVVERFGEALDKELKYNIKAQEVEEVITNEDGSETIVKKTVNVADLGNYSDYAKFFDETCRGWTRDAEYNLMFLKDQQRFANDRLKSRGHLFLNEVYDMIGMDRTKAGNVVGWIYDEKHPNGDNYVDFNIYDIRSAATRRFVNGCEKSILLDFNVDGEILEMI